MIQSLFALLHSTPHSIANMSRHICSMAPSPSRHICSMAPGLSRHICSMAPSLPHHICSRAPSLSCHIRSMAPSLPRHICSLAPHRHVFSCRLPRVLAVDKALLFHEAPLPDPPLQALWTLMLLQDKAALDKCSSRSTDA